MQRGWMHGGEGQRREAPDATSSVFIPSAGGCGSQALQRHLERHFQTVFTYILMLVYRAYLFLLLCAQGGHTKGDPVPSLCPGGLGLAQGEEGDAEVQAKAG